MYVHCPVHVDRQHLRCSVDKEKECRRLESEDKETHHLSVPNISVIFNLELYQVYRS